PSQVIEESDGRIAISFWNALPGEAPLLVKARKLAVAAPPRVAAAGGPEPTNIRSPVSPAAAPSLRLPLDERAHQSREIVYFLQQPETHAFDLYHDYTESRPGVSTYTNEVRAGSKVSKPRARNLDTGEELTWNIVRTDTGSRVRPTAISAPQPSEAVV